MRSNRGNYEDSKSAWRKLMRTEIANEQREPTTKWMALRQQMNVVCCEGRRGVCSKRQ